MIGNRWPVKWCAVMTITWALVGTAVAKPDLVVTDIVLSPSMPGVGDGKLTATIKNIGDEGTGIFVNIDIDMYLDGQKCDSGIIVAGLGKGSSATEETTSCNPTTPGVHKIKFVVDTTSEVSESNENNNSLEKSFTWTGPDLVFLDLKLEPGTPSVGDGKLIATIQNQGPVGTDLLLNIDVTMYLDGQKCDEGIVIAGLGAGSTAKEETTSCNPSTPGPHVVQFVVDSTQEVAETNENNNTIEKTFVWTAPDLVVTQIVVEPDPPEPDQGVKFIATFENKGPVDTECVTINLTYHLDGAQEPCDDGWIVCGLGAGKKTTDETTSCVPSGEGEHTLTVKVDTDNDVAELDEANNTLKKTFSFVVCGKKELCNGKDDNCDGQIDEGFQKVGTACDGPQDTDACKDGVVVCSPDGSLAVCEDGADGKVELCNGLDDDCDTQTDEDFAKLGQPCEGVECKAAGVYVCSADQKGVECEKGDPPDEVCNGKDDDCDGNVDEDYSMVGKGCAVGVGACRKLGKLTCSEGYLSCDAEPGTPAGKEVCGNLIDENCNGIYDEGCACEPGTFLPCGTDVGACTSGVLPCLESGVFFDLCVDAILPGLEICDGQDNDCDGSVDEECECEADDSRECAADAGLCTSGTQHCVDGTWGLCEVNNIAADENCDGVDNDCDGAVDLLCPCAAGEKKTCDFAPDDCAEYHRVCITGGIFGACTPVPGTQIPNCNGGGRIEEDTGDSKEDAGPDNTDSNVGESTGDPDTVSGGVSIDATATHAPAKSAATDDGGCAASSPGIGWSSLILGLVLFILRGVGRTDIRRQ